MRTANPTLSDKAFDRARVAGASAGVMTLSGTVNKVGILTLLLVISSCIAWSMPAQGGALTAIGSIGGFVFAMITIFRPTAAAITAPIYVLFKGLMLGGVSCMLEQVYPGIVMQAVGLTFCTLIGLLSAYKSGMVQATENFRLGVMAATMGIFFVYLLSFLLSFVGIQMPYLHEGGLIGIAVSGFIVVVAALNLVLDFDFIERGAERGAPKHMEWYGAFGLMVTLIWLYIEILRLLAKLRSNR